MFTIASLRSTETRRRQERKEQARGMKDHRDQYCTCCELMRSLSSLSPASLKCRNLCMCISVLNQSYQSRFGAVSIKGKFGANCTRPRLVRLVFSTLVRRHNFLHFCQFSSIQTG